VAEGSQRVTFDRLTVLGTAWGLYGALGTWTCLMGFAGMSDPPAAWFVAGGALLSAAALAGGIGVVLHRSWGARVLESVAATGLVLTIGATAWALIGVYTPPRPTGIVRNAAIIGLLATFVGISMAVYVGTIRMLRRARFQRQVR
jgi:hypothetical protein